MMHANSSPGLWFQDAPVLYSHKTPSLGILKPNGKVDYFNGTQDGYVGFAIKFI